MYYNGAGNSFLGGSDYSVPDPAPVISLCMSGQSGDGNFQTTCINVDADNQIPAGRLPGCTVIRSQNNVTDGCYDPNFTGLVTSTTSLNTLPPIATTSGGPWRVTVTSTATVTRTPNSSHLQHGSGFVFSVWIALIVLYMSMYHSL